MRTAAATALWTILTSRCVQAKDIVPLIPELIPKLNGLVEDGEDKIRSFATKSFKLLFEICDSQIPIPVLVKACLCKLLLVHIALSLYLLYFFVQLS